MLTVRRDLESSPCVFPMISEARDGNIWSGVLVAATSRPIRFGSPPHSWMQRLVADTPSSVVELVASFGLPQRKSGQFSSVDYHWSTPRALMVLISSGESLCIKLPTSSV